MNIFSYLIAEMYYYVWYLALIICACQAQGQVQFNGSSQELLRTATLSVAPFYVANSLSFSFSAWIKRYTTNNGYIISKADNSGCVYSIGFDNTRTNCLRLYFTESSGGATEVYSSVPGVGSNTNIWMHVAFTRTFGAGESSQFWVNGVKQLGGITTGSSGTTPQDAASWPVRLGDGFTGATENFFSGVIEEPYWYYNIVLNDREVGILYNSKVKGIGLQLHATNVVYWPLNTFSMGTTIGSTTNIVLEASKYFKPFSALGSPVQHAERVCSYLPNE